MSFRAPLSVIPSASEESTQWMLHFVQHDKTEKVIPSEARNPVWMLRFAQHDKTEKVIPSVVRNPVRCGCFALLSMTKGKMRFVQHDKTEKVIPSEARNPVRCGCFAVLSMTRREMRIFFRVCIHLIFENNLAKLAGAVWLRAFCMQRQTMQ